MTDTPRAQESAPEPLNDAGTHRVIPGVPDPYLPGRGSADWRPEHYDLDLECKLGGNHLSGRAEITGVALTELRRIEFDLAGLKVIKASVNGKKAAFKAAAARVAVQPHNKLKAGERFTVQLRYAGSPGPRNGLWGEVGWEELTDGVLVAGQPDGAATWFPCNDHQSLKATYRIEVSTDADYRAVANGRLVEHSRKSSRERWVYEVTEPMAPYLATLQIGRYHRVDVSPVPGDAEARLSSDGEPTPAAASHGRRAAAVVPPEQHLLVSTELTREARTAFADQARMIEVFTEAYGPYPFDAYAAVITDDELEIPLEAHGLSVFGRNHLKPGWEQQRLIAHELAHQWFGNSVTASGLGDIWLHEGFACYSEWIWSEAAGLGTADDRARAAYAKLQRSPQDLRVGAPGAKDAFDDRVYKRGALTVHALRSRLGDAAFFGMLRAWTQQYRHALVDTSAFTRHADGYLGGEAEALLRPWLFEAALPPFPAP